MGLSGYRIAGAVSGQARGVTASQLIEVLLEDHERRQRMEAFGRAVRSADEGYRDEFLDWDVTLGDGGEAD